MTNQTIPPCPVCGTVPEKHLFFNNAIHPKCKHLLYSREKSKHKYGELYITVERWRIRCTRALGRACRELGVETVEQLKAKVQPDPRVAELSGYITVLLDLATDAANGLEYVRDVHGDLYGVGFDRVKIKAEVLPVIRLKMTQLISAPRGEG